MYQQKSVLVIDDHPVTHVGCHNLLTELGFIKILEAYDSDSGRSIAEKERPDLIIVDLALPGIGGLALIGQLILLYPSVRLLVFSMHDDPVFAAKSLEAGAHGFLTKSSGVKEFMAAIKTIMKNEIFLEHKMATQLAVMKSGQGASPLSDLTQRELQILQLIGEGKSHSAIAEQLCISYKTVANTIAKLKDKLGVKRLLDLVRIAIEHT